MTNQVDMDGIFKHHDLLNEREFNIRCYKRHGFSKADNSKHLEKLRNDLEASWELLDSWPLNGSWDAMLTSIVEQLISQDRSVVSVAVKSIWEYVTHLNVVRRTKRGRQYFQQHAKLVERILFALQGYWQHQPRASAIRGLNVLYDSVDWQRNQAFHVTHKEIGDPFKIQHLVLIPSKLKNNIRLLLCAPSFDPESAEDCLLSCHHNIKIDTTGPVSNAVTATVTIQLSNFPRCGFYDYRFVGVSNDGSVRCLKLVKPPSAKTQGTSAVTPLAQGRIIVHNNKMSNELVHEVLVDLEGQSFSKEKKSIPTKMRHRGTFESVCDALPTYVSRGLTTVHLVGALDRDNGFDPTSDVLASKAAPELLSAASSVDPLTEHSSRPDASPTAITDRTVVNRMLGGQSVFQRLCDQAKLLKVKISLSFSAAVSASRCARRYESLLCYMLDSQGNRVVHRGTDAKENQWEDTQLLNYRKLASMEMFIADATKLIDQYGISALQIDDCQSFPPVLAADCEELFSFEANGDKRFTPLEIFEGELVHWNAESGFWNASNTELCRGYSNPALVKMCREIWKNHPTFTMIGESAWNRSDVLSISGLVPRSCRFVRALANVHSREIMKNGLVSDLEEVENTVKPLYDWLDEEIGAGNRMNQQILHCCSLSLPYPAMLFGRNAWSVVDVMYLLPGIPLSFIGEEKGRSYRFDIANTYSHNQEWQQLEAKRIAQRRQLVGNKMNGNFVQKSSSLDAAAANTSAEVADARFPSKVNGTSVVKKRSNSMLSPVLGPTDIPEGNGLISALSPIPNLGNPYTEYDTDGEVDEMEDPLERSRFFFKEQEWLGVGQSEAIPDSALSTVKSWANFATAEHPTDNVNVGMFRVRSINKLNNLVNYNELTSLEERYIKYVGPEYGFDLSKIGDHYLHRSKLRQKYEVLTKGLIVPLRAYHRYGIHHHVFAFARYLEFDKKEPKSSSNEVCVIAINFNSSPSSFTIDCKPLVDILGVSDPTDETLVSRPTIIYDMVDILHQDREHREDILDLWTPAEVASQSNLVTLSPHKAIAWHFKKRNLTDRAAEKISAVGEERINRWRSDPISNMDVTDLDDTSSDEGDSKVDEDDSQRKGTNELLRNGSRVSSLSRESSVGMPSPQLQQISDVEKKFFRSSLSRLNRLLNAHEQMLSRKQSNLHTISSDESVLPDIQLKNAVSSNHIFSMLSVAINCCIHRLIQAAHKRREEFEDSVEEPDEVQQVPLDAKLKRKQSSGNFMDKFMKGNKVVTKAALDSMNDITLVEHFYSSFGASLGVAKNYNSLQNDMMYALQPLGETFDLLIHQLLCKEQIVSDNDVRGRSLNSSDVTGIPAVAVNADSWLSILVKTIAPILRKVLWLAVLGHHFTPVEKYLMSWLSLLANPKQQPTGMVPEPNIENQEDPDISNYASILAKEILSSNQNDMKEVVFMAPELGKWSKVGGLGVMVDELTVGLASFGLNVTVISPFYNYNSKGQMDYLRADGILWLRNIHVTIGDDSVEVGIHQGKVNGVRVIFLHNATYFPVPYPSGNSYSQIRILMLMAKASLETCCQLKLIPKLIVTNDWFTGLIAAYAKSGNFGSVFNDTFFFHLVHNLDPTYEGRIYVNVNEQFHAHHLVSLPPDLLQDPFWNATNDMIVLNPSRAALLCSDSWGTVSPSYLQELISQSPLKTLLMKKPHPFAHVNGIPVVARHEKLQSLSTNSHATAKALIQKRYFQYAFPDLSIPLFCFVGRITLQKGVHLILRAAESLIHQTNGRVQFLVGGPANQAEPYAAECVIYMNYLTKKYPSSFWANPSLFFTDGELINLGADFGLMPSLFEPSGIVQQEFFIAGTPVIAFNTGGLKDTVFDFDSYNLKGNGFTFKNHSVNDFKHVIHRALEVFHVESLYCKLRENAEKSTLDLTTVCWEWYKEFSRCKRCLLGRISTTLRLTVDDVEHHDVYLVGDFTDWTGGVKMERNPDVFSAKSSEYFITLYFQPGVYKYKFKLDETWVLDKHAPVIKEVNGIRNHIIFVNSV